MMNVFIHARICIIIFDHKIFKLSIIIYTVQTPKKVHDHSYMSKSTESIFDWV